VLLIVKGLLSSWGGRTTNHDDDAGCGECSSSAAGTVLTWKAANDLILADALLQRDLQYSYIYCYTYIYYMYNSILLVVYKKETREVQLLDYRGHY